jgi:hypothetical protein
MNKKYVIGFIVLLLGNNIFGQDRERKFTVQADPVMFFYDIIALGMWDDDNKSFYLDMEGQYKINNSLNVSLTVSFIINNFINTTYDYGGYGYESYNEDTFHINIKPMLLYRPFKTGLKGFSMGLYPDIGLRSIKNKYEDRVYTAIGLGLAMGYKWILKNGFTMQLGSGISKTLSIPQEPEYSVDFLMVDSKIPLKNFDVLLLDFKVGYSF